MNILMMLPPISKYIFPSSHIPTRQPVNMAGVPAASRRDNTDASPRVGLGSGQLTELRHGFLEPCFLENLLSYVNVCSWNLGEIPRLYVTLF